VWALEAYGGGFHPSGICDAKSDDRYGRTKNYRPSSGRSGHGAGRAGIVQRLIRELQSSVGRGADQAGEKKRC